MLAYVRPKMTFTVYGNRKEIHDIKAIVIQAMCIFFQHYVSMLHVGFKINALLLIFVYY